MIKITVEIYAQGAINIANLFSFKFNSELDLYQSIEHYQSIDIIH